MGTVGSAQETAFRMSRNGTFLGKWNLSKTKEADFGHSSSKLPSTHQFWIVLMNERKPLLQKHITDMD